MLIVYACLKQVAEMLFELCVTELEDVAADKEVVRSVMQPVVQESSHPYTDDTSVNGSVRIPGVHTCLLSTLATSVSVDVTVIIVT